MSDAIERRVTARVSTGRKGRTETLPGTVVVRETGMQFDYTTLGHTRKVVLPREQIAFVAADTPLGNFCPPSNRTLIRRLIRVSRATCVSRTA